MPRTKVSTKNSKRNREAAMKEDKIREFERSLEAYVNNIDLQGNAFIGDIEAQLERLIECTVDSVLNEPIVNIINLNLSKFSEYGNIQANSSTSLDATQMKATRVASVNDDGYITEESTNSASNSALTAYLSMTQRGRTPGPYNSAQARRQRRSRSACSDNLTRSIASSKTQTRNAPISEHASRNKLRTPIAARPKAFSADRSVIKNGENGMKSPACAFLRWPKPGEFVVSVHGSPLISQVMPDRYANVNIPIKDGVLSLRPKKLADLDTELVNKFDEETLHQIKTLHKNLDMIVSLANKNKK